jgi:hypothetical protein
VLALVRTHVHSWHYRRLNNPLIQGSDPCASVSICGLNDYVNSVNSVKNNHHTLVTIVYSNMPFSNCLQAKCNGQFNFFVKIISTMSYTMTRQWDAQKNSRLMGGQIPAKTSRKTYQIKGIFASLRPVRPICPFGRIRCSALGVLPRRSQGDLSTIASERRWKAGRYSMFPDSAFRPDG